MDVKNPTHTVDREKIKYGAFAAAYCVALAVGERRYAVGTASKAVNISRHTGKEWSKHPYVISEIKRRVEAATEAQGWDKPGVLGEIVLVARSDIRDYFERVGKDGIKPKCVLDMGPEAKAVKTIKHKQKVTIAGEGESRVETVENEYEYVFWDKMKALEVLAQFHKIIEGGQHGPDQHNTIFYVPVNRFTDTAGQRVLQGDEVQLLPADGGGQ